MTSLNTSILRITRTNEFGFAEIKLLYQRAFTNEERRDPADLDQLLEHPDFSFYLVNHYSWPAGLIAVWQFPDFVFIEHMAVSEQFRNRRIGANALEQLLALSELPLVLESEQPVDETTSSRLNFYKRQGFQVIDADYLQPPYRKENEPLPMVLLSNHPYPAEEASMIAAAIKAKVYPSFR
ncbi:MAG: GNAT family N-acetyltransferase [Lentimicrobium sp.]|jgi:ribosomal protein S18 acetylase RimI-like enzyme|nr:GNAT family N-acetyltransferase [Lentimicrobium sp.]